MNQYDFYVQKMLELLDENEFCSSSKASHRECYQDFREYLMRLKCLCWDINGFAIYYKRLDGAGARFKWPKEPTDVRNITVKQLSLLMGGMSIDPPKGFGEVKARDFC